MAITCTYTGIDLPESVADHMYRMSMLAFALRDPAVNRDRLIKICLVHDLAEALVGDITPHDQKVTKEQKRVLEEVSVRVNNKHEDVGVAGLFKTQSFCFHVNTASH